MCCRYLLVQEHLRAILDRLGIPAPGVLPATRYNIAPGTAIPAVRRHPRAEVGRELAPLHWGLVPSWARHASDGIVNARAESLADKPSFRDAFARQRCLIPASGFYEWQAQGRTRKPWLFRRRDEDPFCLAGLWATWRAPDGTVLESCAVITTAPNTLMAPIHHRMPVVLAESDWAAWLDPDLREPSSLTTLLQPCPAALLQAVAVSARVSNIRNDDPACLEPAGADSASDDQLTLL